MSAVIIPAVHKLRLFDLAGRRNGCKHPSWSRRASDIFTDHEVDYIGLKGEYAVCKHFGTRIDQRIHSHGDAGHDLTLPDGRRAMVKFNHRVRGYFMIERERDFSAPVGVSVYGECDPPRTCLCRDMGRADRVMIGGWISREQFFRVCRKTDWGLGPRWYVPQWLLSPVAVLSPPPL